MNLLPLRSTIPKWKFSVEDHFFCWTVFVNIEVALFFKLEIKNR